MTSRIVYNNPDATGALGLPYHYELLSDGRRLAPLRRAIQQVAKDRRVLESGAGSGVLSILAARAGARRVYAIEKDPAMVRIARQNLEAAGCGAVVRLLEKDTRSLTLRDVDGWPVDMVIMEHLSTWQVTEPQISVVNHVNRDLTTPSTAWIPECAYNCVELVNSRFRFEEVVELRTYYFGFTGIRKPRVLSAPTLFRTVDFRGVNETVINESVQVVATREGVVNSLRLTSPLRIFGPITFRSSDSLMPPVVVPLRSDLEVREGDVVGVRVRYRCETSWEEFACDAARVGTRLNAAPSPLLVAAVGAP